VTTFVDTATKERATDALAAMGLSISDAIRLLMLRVVDERRSGDWAGYRECHVKPDCC
jgi:addiction module RelB/DinJ family antitoxin